MEDNKTFKPTDMFEYKAAKRLFDNIKASSRPRFAVGLARYCTFLQQTPDAIIESRKNDVRQGVIDNDEEIRRSHEDHFRQFQEYLAGLTKKDGEPLSPNTMNSNLTAVKAFYSQNYYQLQKPKKLDVWNVRNLHVPTPEEVGKMIELCEDPLHKAVIAAEAQSGIGTGDLLSLKWTQQSDTFGSVKKQLETGITVDGKVARIIHIHMVREKTHVAFDSFFGETTTKLLTDKDYPQEERMFPISARYFQRIVEKVSKEAEVPGVNTPHSLRKFFTTQLKTATVNSPSFNNDLVEYWCGHSLGRTRSAYFRPPPLEQARLYLMAQPRITPIFSK